MNFKKEINLTNYEIDVIKKILEDGYTGNYEDGCLCGYYEFFIETIGYVTVRTYCRKSNGCPDGISWYVDPRISVWDKTINVFGYVPTEEEATEEGLKLLGYLEEISAANVKEKVRTNIIENYSWRNADEYGNTPEDLLKLEAEKEKILEDSYDYKKAYEEVILFLTSLKISCSNCSCNKENCNSCVAENSNWTLDTNILPDISKFKINN